MDDAAAGGHELEVAGVDGALVAGEVFVVDGAREEVCDCFLATVRVVGEASVLDGVLVVAGRGGGGRSQGQW